MAAVIASARLIMSDKIRGGSVTDQMAGEISAIFPQWRPNLVVAVDDLYAFHGTVVQCIEAHTTQADWAPDVSPSLWKVYRDPTAGPKPWKQPLGSTDAYALNAEVTWKSKTWKSNVANNVWEPGVYGWDEVTA